MRHSIARNGISRANEYVVGIIGMGDMGKMYTRRLSEAGYT